MADEVVQPQPPQPPPGHYFVDLKGRQVLVKNINESQSMVLGGYLHDLGSGANFEKIMDIFGKLMRLMRNLIVRPEDLDWLEEQILDGAVEVGDFASIFHNHDRVADKPTTKKPKRGK